MEMPFNFYYPTHINYLLLRALCFGLRKYLEIIYFKESISLFIMFLGESFAIIIYLYQKFHLLKSNKKLKQFKPKDTINYMEIIKIYFMIFICSFCDLVGCYNFQIMGKNIQNLKSTFNMIFLCIFIALNEHFYLNIPTYNYHILGYGLFIISILIDLLVNINYFTKNHIFLIIISLESQYIESLFYIIEKQLNYIYFIKIAFICFCEGIFGMLISVIYSLFNGTIFNLFPKNDNVFIIILYCLLTCIANLSRLRVTEISRPSYNLIGKIICSLLINLVSSIYDNENNKYKWNSYNILIMILSLLSTFIFVEVITLNFCNLNQNIKNNIIKRGIQESELLNSEENAEN